MTTRLTLNASPSAGFDQPFEMLQACHQRVLRMLQLLERLAAHVVHHAADESAQQAALDICRYFDLAGPDHHEDEEKHLFPALLAQGESQVVAMVCQLQADHRCMLQQWVAVREDLMGIAGGAAPPAQASSLRWREFTELYQRHIEQEERVVYPAAESLFNEAAERTMGAEMAARRGAFVGLNPKSPTAKV
ncbi:MAG: hemerythrin domain-containing protein [Burkholderiaceae bacterium]